LNQQESPLHSSFAFGKDWLNRYSTMVQYTCGGKTAMIVAA